MVIDMLRLVTPEHKMSKRVYNCIIHVNELDRIDFCKCFDCAASAGLLEVVGELLVFF